ncbi:hypothetical protein ACJX0J_037496, partial [Zea mays]
VRFFNGTAFVNDVILPVNTTMQSQKEKILNDKDSKFFTPKILYIGTEGIVFILYFVRFFNKVAFVIDTLNQKEKEILNDKDSEISKINHLEMVIKILKLDPEGFQAS